MLFVALVTFVAFTLAAISGIGGGVVIIPLLVSFLGREWSPASIASLSLSLVLLNALTSLFVGKQIQNADLKFAKPMAVISSVGAVAGVFMQSYVSRESFEIVLSVFLLLLSLFIFWRSSHADKNVPGTPEPFHGGDSVFGLAIGVIASFFGLGGGVLQVPYMVYLRKRSVKQSTATSQVILSTTAVVSLVIFLGVRRVPVPWDMFITLAPVVFVGGLLGSALAKKMRGPWIVRLLAGVLLLMAVRVGLRALQIEG